MCWDIAYECLHPLLARVDHTYEKIVLAYQYGKDSHTPPHFHIQGQLLYQLPIQRQESKLYRPQCTPKHIAVDEHDFAHGDHVRDVVGVHCSLPCCSGLPTIDWTNRCKIIYCLGEKEEIGSQEDVVGGHGLARAS